MCRDRGRAAGPREPLFPLPRSKMLSPAFDDTDTDFCDGDPYSRAQLPNQTPMLRGVDPLSAMATDDDDDVAARLRLNSFRPEVRLAGPACDRIWGFGGMRTLSLGQWTCAAMSRRQSASLTV